MCEELDHLDFSSCSIQSVDPVPYIQIVVPESSVQIPQHFQDN